MPNHNAGGPLPDSYEKARTELAEIVRSLETGNQTLEGSLALWERGEALAELCESWLQAARARLDNVIAGRQQPAPPDRVDGADSHNNANPDPEVTNPVTDPHNG